MDIFSKFKNNIVFLPVKSQLKVKYLDYGNVILKVSYNLEERFIFDAYSRQFVCSERKKSKELIGSIAIIADENLYACRYDRSKYIEGEALTKQHPMYNENASNVFFETDEEIVHVFHYPNEYITVIKKNKNEFLAVVSNELDGKTQLVSAIKKLVSRYNYYNNIYSLHCAAVKKDEQAVLFLGGSYCGKTTLFLNLICNGYEPVNDDVVYWKFENGKVLVSGMPSGLNIRKQPNDLIMSDGFCTRLKNRGFHNIYTADVFEYLTIHTIYVPEFGFDKSEVIDEVKIDSRRILRACATHSNVCPTNDFLKAFNALLSCEFKKIKMSRDYNDVIRCIIDPK